MQDVVAASPSIQHVVYPSGVSLDPAEPVAEIFLGLDRETVHHGLSWLMFDPVRAHGSPVSGRFDPRAGLRADMNPKRKRRFRSGAETPLAELRCKSLCLLAAALGAG
jgi:hypothetical protein